MASWVGVSLFLAGLIIGFAVAAFCTGVANSELAEHNWRLIRESEDLRSENSDLKVARDQLEKLVGTVTEEAL